jgi:hypothetical protein
VTSNKKYIQKGAKKMKKKFTILLTIVMSLLFIFIVDGLAKSEIFNEGDENISMSFFHPCTKEWVDLEGTSHYWVRIMEKSPGVYNIKMHDNMHLVGIGQESGEEYIFNCSTNWKWNKWDDNLKFDSFPLEITGTSTQSLISKGENANAIIKIRYRYIVNANGEVSAYIDKFEIVCTGQNP